jgi:diguanylate cyclase (GGDEF)-like protein/PAS domain S-box-containing protein
MIFIAIVWLVGDLLARVSSTQTQQLTAELFRYFGATMMSPAILIFTTQYRGKDVSTKIKILLFIIPSISWLMVWTNEWHHLFWSYRELRNLGPMRGKFGFYFWFIHIPYSYILLLISISSLISEISRAPRFYRNQLLIFLVSLCIPILANMGYLSGLTGQYTVISFSFFLIVFAIGFFRYEFLGSNPIAYETVFQTIRDSVVVLNSKNIVTDINPSAAKGLGKTPKDLIGLHAKDVFAEWQDLYELYENEKEAIDEVELVYGDEKRYFSIQITPLNSVSGTLLGRIITLRDITLRKRHEKMLEDLAYKDTLTQLANRRMFQTEAERAVAAADISKETLAILYFDLNNFKSINDTYGHDVGDIVLKYVAHRASSKLRQHDFIARLGGDEFAVLLINADRMSVEYVAERILSAFIEPLKVQNNTFQISLSIGAAIYPEHGTELNELIRNADKAMYESKTKGGGLTFSASPKKVSEVIIG